MVDVVGQFVKTEIFGYAVHAPRFGLRLERAQEDLAGVLLEIGIIVRVTQHRQAGMHAFNRVGHHVEMLAGMQGHQRLGHGTHVPAPHARAVDHDIRADPRAADRDPGDLALLHQNIRDLGVLQHLCTACAGALGQGLS